MFKLKRIIYAFLNRYFPEQAYRFVSRAPQQLRLSQHHVESMEAIGMYRIRVSYSRNHGCVVQHCYWKAGNKTLPFHPNLLRSLQGAADNAYYLPPEFLHRPRDVLLIACNVSGEFEVYAGPSYEHMSAVEFEDMMSLLIENAEEAMKVFAIYHPVRTC
jgi:hypothetical protein